MALTRSGIVDPNCSNLALKVVKYPNGLHELPVTATAAATVADNVSEQEPNDNTYFPVVAHLVTSHRISCLKIFSSNGPEFIHSLGLYEKDNYCAYVER